MKKGMLRITPSSESHSGVFILAGKLTGLWARELLRVARGTNQGRGNVFDLQRVSFVDSKGKEVLRLLAGRGGKFITDSAYGKDLCSQLKLDRIGRSELRAESGKVRGGSCNLASPAAVRNEAGDAA